MQNLNKLINVFYIYISKKDKFSTRVPTELLEIKKEYEKDIANVNVKIINFNNIHALLNDFDKEFADLFSMIDKGFEAAMADIGRIILLYKHGGIYHDAHWRIKDQKSMNMIQNILKESDLILEKSPNTNQFARNGNMVSKPKLNFLKEILYSQKMNLKRIYATNSKCNIYTEVGIGCIYNKLVNSYANLHKLINKNKNTNSYLILFDDFKICVKYLVDDLKNYPKFYKKNKNEHWSVLQTLKPLLRSHESFK